MVKALRAMLKIHRKRQANRALGKRLAQYRTSKLITKCFLKWYLKFTKIDRARTALVAKTNRTKVADVFKLWRSKFLTQREFMFKMHCFNEKVRVRELGRIFGVMSHYLLRKMHTSKQKRAAHRWFR